MPSSLFISSIRSSYHEKAKARRQVIALASEAQSASKRSIFSLQRGDVNEASRLLGEAEALFGSIALGHKKTPFYKREGSYIAALEEYAEAYILFSIVAKGAPPKKLPKIDMEDETYLAGLCDVPGELYRLAVRSATRGEIEQVEKYAGVGDDIIAALIEFDFTSYLRNKFDQAKQAAQKLEQLLCDIKIRKG